MFEIEYKGGNSVIISTKKAKVVVDPKTSLIGLKDLNVKDAIELATEERFAINSSDASVVIDGPGDYGVSDLDIHGVAARRHIDEAGRASTMYRIEIGESRIGIIGNIDEKLSEEQFEELGLLDILIIPVGGGGYTLDSTSAAGLVRHISPKLVIPVHYKDTNLKYEVPQDDLSVFINELGAPVETMAKYKSKQAAIPIQLGIIELTRS